MRVLFALGLVVSVSACFGGAGEPLSSTQRAARQTPVSQQAPDHALTPRQQAIVDIQVQTQLAHDAAYASAAAGRAHDIFGAQQAAVDLANAATTIHARAVTIASIDGNTSSGGGGCGCEGCDDVTPPSDSVSGDPAVDDAVTVSALAAEVGGNVADDLQPPSETQCSQVCGCEGCSDSCQEVPGTVDEGQLGSDVDAATDAGDANLDASQNLGAEIG